MNRRAEWEARWRAAVERGDCTCVEWALLHGLIKDPDDPLIIDPSCEHHRHLLEDPDP